MCELRAGRLHCLQAELVTGSLCGEHVAGAPATSRWGGAGRAAWLVISQDPGVKHFMSIMAGEWDIARCIRVVLAVVFHHITV